MNTRTLHLLIATAIALATTANAQQASPPPPGSVLPAPAPAQRDSPATQDDHAPDRERARRHSRDPESRPHGGEERRKAPQGNFLIPRHDRGAAKLAPTPFLGVVTAPVPPVLAAQVGLQEGFGLVVEEVLPDSPAHAAGLQRHDVLKLLNEQQLVDVGQLTTLIRSFGKDTEISVTFLRSGKEQKATVKLGEKMLPPPRREGAGNPMTRKLLGFEGGEDTGELARRLEEGVRKFGKDMETYHDRFRQWQKSSGRNAPAPPPPPQLDPLPGGLPPPQADILREVRPGGAAEVRIYQPEGNTTFQTSNARVTLNDADGSLELSTTDGKRTLVAKNAAGATVFTGPIDTEEQRARVPAPFAGKLDLLANQSGVAVRGNGIEASASSTTSSTPPAAPNAPTSKADPAKVQ